MPCDVLIFAPHPDDAELHCGATIARQVRLGATVVVIDATAGELGSRGTVEGRGHEAAAAAEVLGLAGRDNLGLPDGRLDPADAAGREAVVAAIRRHRPGLILGMHPQAVRHPDHRALGLLLRDALKLAAIHSYGAGPAFAGACLLEYEAELPVLPQFIVPCEEQDRERKRAALACHASQFGLDQREGPQTAIADPAFLAWVDARGRSWGYHAGAAYGEALLSPQAVNIKDLERLR